MNEPKEYQSYGVDKRTTIRGPELCIININNNSIIMGGCSNHFLIKFYVFRLFYKFEMNLDFSKSFNFWKNNAVISLTGIHLISKTRCQSIGRDPFSDGTDCFLELMKN